ncbi:MAG: 50S ribosomal protein L23 [Anaerolineae bacterium]
MNIYEVLRRPVITEKSNLLGEEGRYVFEVARDANKALVKEAVEMRFGVTVTDVNVMRVRGKTRRFGRRITRTPWWKKAIVTVAPGQKIEVYEA